MIRRLRGLAWTAPWVVVCAALADADTPMESANSAAFFESKIRPILAASCYECHGPEKKSGELRLDTLGDMLHGGDSGPAIVVGNPDESLLIQAVSYDSLEMPPTGKLSDDKIALLKNWISMGAPWPNAEVSADAMKPRDKGREITDEDRQFWSFQPPQRSPTPDVTHPEQTDTPVDRFLLSRLDRVGLTFSESASRPEWVRRLSLDLEGLPPSGGLEDEDRPDAFARRVDRHLASPHFGERWGRHWLDVVRFAQTNGYERDAEKPFAWRYRDYVIESFNEDKPFDQFVREQVAGDELDMVTDETIIATGFTRLGVWDDEPDDKANAEYEALDDIVSTTGQAVLGLTIGCARCHDHKFDPITQQDYYSLVAFFRNVREYEKFEGNKKDFAMLLPLSTGEQALAIREAGLSPPPTRLLIRGDARTPGAEVSPRFLEVLCRSSEASQVSTPTPAPEAKSLGRRRVLADWLTRPDQPLTARVIVNRLWQHHFGRGLVETPSDFGKTGTPPSHPELLDWLAVELVEGGWSLKHLHRVILESTAYRQSSRNRQQEGVKVDPDNRLLWRQTMRRLEAESMRDAVLTANGRLVLEMGGRGFFPSLPTEVLSTQSIPGNGWGDSSADQQARRSLYIFAKRTLKPPLLETFDAANPDQAIAARTVTTIAPQALLWMNSQFMEEESLALADVVAREAGPELNGQLALLYRRTLGREPTAVEVSQGRSFVESQRESWRTLLSGVPLPHPLGSAEKLGGTWSAGGEREILVEPDVGGKIIWPGRTLGDGVVEATVHLTSAVGDLGILLRVQDAQAGVDSLTAYNVSLMPDAICVGKHRGDFRKLARSALPATSAGSQRLKIELAGGQIRVWVAGSERPLIDVVDPDPLPAGKMGLRTNQAGGAFRDVRARTSSGSWLAGEPRPEHDTTGAEVVDASARRALAALAKLILNTNEYVYVD